MSLLITVLFFLVAALIFAPIAKRYTFSTILGFTIAGLLLGPSVFKLIDDVDEIQLLTDLGMLAVLFFLGFYLKPKQLWQQRHHVLKLYAMPLALISIVLCVACFLLLDQLLLGCLLGLSLSFSSVFLVQQFIEQKNQIHSQLGQNCLTAVQLQSCFAVILMILFPLLEDTATTRHGIAYFAAIIATISGLFLASRYLVRPAFHYLARHKSLELLPILSTLVLLSIFLILQILNIHILIAAFLAGLVLAETDFRTEIGNFIQPFKHALIGLLFFALGLNLTLNPLFQTPVFIVAAIVGLVVIKAGIIGVTSYFQQRQLKLSNLSAVLLAQSGELTFILLKIAESEKVISTQILQPTLVVVFGSMLLTPPLFWLVNSKVLPLILKKPVQPDSDEVAQHPILILGFGRFGQIIARVLHAQGQHFSVIDSNQPAAHFIEQYGHRFIDADVTQIENLRIAGIEHCKLAILVIDDVEDSMNLARHLRLNYPELILFARARDRHHAHLLHQLGVQQIYRETYLSSLGMAEDVLIETGLSIDETKTRIEEFKQHDQMLLRSHYSTYDEDDQIERYPNALAELEYLFENTSILAKHRLMNEQNTQSEANSQQEIS
ncbi:cation:proton antiporter [Acinetobacter junii]|uniref:cation:proton antiporter domain-containing protein n=1 Tax=Acinetobacter junii TaxID=40215 RepID=UPI001BAB1B6D|nr:cation:proton antiporter [Acinetobacter junii]QUS50445.1 cation:proton antiporter [Acinetobacter junii]